MSDIIWLVLLGLQYLLFGRRTVKVGGWRKRNVMRLLQEPQARDSDDLLAVGVVTSGRILDVF